MTWAESVKQNRMWLFTSLLLLAWLYARIVPGMVKEWSVDANYSHGFIVPLIAGYFLYERRQDLLDMKVEAWWPGLALLLCGVAQLILGWVAVEYFTMRSSLLVVLAGLSLFLWGKNFSRLTVVPLCYLIFMIPLPYIIYDSIAFPLKLFVTKVSIAFLKLAGVVVMREGNIIILPTTTLEVADACSGIRSLISLLALAVAYSLFLKMTPLKRVVLIVSAIPIAVCANASRVIGTGFLAQYWGASAAEGFFHEFAGLAVFAVAIVLLVSLGTLLNIRDRRAQ